MCDTSVMRRFLATYKMKAFRQLINSLTHINVDADLIFKTMIIRQIIHEGLAVLIFFVQRQRLGFTTSFDAHVFVNQIVAAKRKKFIYKGCKATF